MTNSLHAISRDLEQARQDVALLARLQGAEKRASDLEVAYAIAAEAQAADDTAKAEQARIARMDGITALTITETPSKDDPGNVLSSSFTITYSKPAYCMYAGKSHPQAHKVNGFAALSPGAMQFLIEECPKAIPAGIMALAPGNPSEAFSSYFLAKRRGHL